mmetsp:Transcript_28149/g.81377  ORF Transcript_28149/g.81377 Transcript_28149/m.81377 type:complete len:289 (-) Transcript_28149:300-1166(-)
MASNQLDRRSSAAPVPLKSILKTSQRRQPVTNAHSTSLQEPIVHVAQAQPPPSNKSVAFNRRTRVYLIATLYEMSQQEYDSCFITDAESKEAQGEMIASIIAMRGGRHDNDENQGICFRGIEHMRSAASMSQRNDHKQHVTDSILDAQDEDEDPDHIAAVSRQVTQWAVESALTKASSDAAFVRRLQRNESRSNLAPDSLLRAQEIQHTLDEALSTSPTEDGAGAANNNWHRRCRSWPRLTTPSTLALDLAQGSIGKPSRRNSFNSVLDQMSSRVSIYPHQNGEVEDS